MIKKLDNWYYYIGVGILSLITLVFLPMLGNELNFNISLPNTWSGWVVFAITKILVAIVNMLLFHCFVQQAQLNIADEITYKLANRILLYFRRGDYVPQGPEAYFKEIYSKKSTMVAVTSLLSVIGLSCAVLAFDPIAFITYLFTILMGLVFGLIQMKAVENYWTGTYFDYALYTLTENGYNAWDIVKRLEEDEHLYMSTIVEEINNVNNEQQRELVLD